MSQGKINLNSTVKDKANVSRKAQYKEVCRRTIEILQHSHIFKAKFAVLKVHNAHLKLASPISG